jgi:origin recognition complex subunit 3
MNFDLELLSKFMQEHGLQKVVVSIPDAEAYDLSVLAELLATLQSWIDRIQFTILLGIATTIPLFESRLSKTTIRHLDTKSFDFSSTTDKLYDLFCRVQCSSHPRLFLNPATIKALADIAEDQSTTPSSFIRVLKYIFMTHFFANPLTILISLPLSEKPSTDSDSLCQSIRNTSSFQTYCSYLLEHHRSDSSKVKDLLEKDAYLLAITQPSLLETTNHQQRLNQRIEQIVKLYKHLQPNSESSLFLHYKLLHSLSSTGLPDEIKHQISTSLQSLTSTDLQNLMSTHKPIFESMIANMKRKPQIPHLKFLSDLNKKHGTQTPHPIHPQPNRNSTSTSTVKEPAGTYAEGLYSGFLWGTESNLMDYISPPLPAPPAFPTEAIIFANPGIVRNTFQPRPRFTLERALSRPKDYLDWDFAAPAPPVPAPAPKTKAQRSSARRKSVRSMNNHIQPSESETTEKIRVEKEPTPLLYNLLNQASRDVNVRDLWDRFAMELNSNPNPNPNSNPKHKHKHNTQDEDEEGKHSNEENDEDKDEENINYLPLFYNALAELKMMGLITGKNTDNVKGSKGVRGVDVVSRSTWAGL